MIQHCKSHRKKLIYQNILLTTPLVVFSKDNLKNMPAYQKEQPKPPSIQQLHWKIVIIHLLDKLSTCSSMIYIKLVSQRMKSQCASYQMDITQPPKTDIMDILPQSNDSIIQIIMLLSLMTIQKIIPYKFSMII